MHMRSVHNAKLCFCVCINLIQDHFAEWHAAFKSELNVCNLIKGYSYFRQNEPLPFYFGPVDFSCDVFWIHLRACIKCLFHL